LASFKVLILDHSRLNRELITSLLRESGFDADAVGDLEGFEKALTWWKPTSLVIDAGLPTESAIDVALRAREQFPQIPIILMSAMPLDSLRRLGTECDAAECFSTLDGFAGLIDCLYSVYDDSSA
jgi:DNA-binding response OmpR family regulator